VGCTWPQTDRAFVLTVWGSFHPPEGRLVSVLRDSETPFCLVPGKHRDLWEHTLPGVHPSSLLSKPKATWASVEANYCGAGGAKECRCPISPSWERHGAWSAACLLLTLIILILKIEIPLPGGSSPEGQSLRFFAATSLII
jgi:hypothetical protein